jgi:hypothetical protein
MYQPMIVVLLIEATYLTVPVMAVIMYHIALE